MDIPALHEARRAIDDLDWGAAVDAFRVADDEAGDLSASDLDAYSTALYLTGDVHEAVFARSRAHDALVESGRVEEALRHGFWITFMLLESGEMAQASGWLARCERLLAGLPADSPAHAYSQVHGAYRLVAVEGDHESGQDAARRAIAIASQAGDRDTETLALNVVGRSLLRTGQVDEGLAALDEAMVAVTSGGLSPIVVGSVYCSLIEACEEIAELGRAREWTEALHRWCERQRGEIPFTAQCRIHRSKIFRRLGDLDGAEDEARIAHGLFSETSYEHATGAALYQLGEVLRTRGAFEDAEVAYHEAGRHGVDPQPGLALVHLARGHVGAASASMQRLLGETTEEVARVDLLPAFVEVMVAAGEVDAAKEAVAELDDLASRYRTVALEATAAQARGTVRLADGDPEGALFDLREALSRWRDVPSRLAAARTRFLIGHACSELGDDETAALEFEAVRREFAELGVAAMPDDPGRRQSMDHGLTERELEVLRCLASGATNKDIADDLFISVRTVDRHVGNILTKLDVPSRTAAVAFAYEHDLL